MIKYFFILFFLVSINVAFSQEVFIWRQFKDAPAVLMAKKANQTHQEAIDEYFANIHTKGHVQGLLQQEELQPLITGSGKLPHSYGEFQNIQESKKPRIIIVTNELRELFSPPYSKRSANFKKRLEQLGAEVFILPVMHDINLNAKESKKYREKIINLFDAQLIMGGADIDPYLYGENVTFAKNLNRARDVSELKFVRQFIKAKKGMNFGICRGHQMCAVAYHKKLVQDIQIEEGASPVHLEGEHLINYDNKSEIFNVFDEDKLLVNSLHHQAVVLAADDKDYKVIATSMDNNPIVEGIEFKNGLGVTLQFHPELMDNDVGDRIMKKYVELTAVQKERFYKKVSCLELMKGFL